MDESDIFGLDSLTKEEKEEYAQKEKQALREEKLKSLYMKALEKRNTLPASLKIDDLKDVAASIKASRARRFDVSPHMSNSQDGEIYDPDVAATSSKSLKSKTSYPSPQDSDPSPKGSYPSPRGSRRRQGSRDRKSSRGMADSFPGSSYRASGPDSAYGVRKSLSSWYASSSAAGSSYNSGEPCHDHQICVCVYVCM